MTFWALISGFLVGFDFDWDSFLRRGRFYVIVGVLLFDSCFWLPTTWVLNPCGGYFGSREFFGFCRFPMDRRRVHKCYPTFLQLGGCGSGCIRLRCSIKWIRIVIQFFIIFQDGWAWVWSLLNFWKVSAIVLALLVSIMQLKVNSRGLIYLRCESFIS